MVVKSDKCMGVSKLLGAHARAASPKVYAYDLVDGFPFRSVCRYHVVSSDMALGSFTTVYSNIGSYRCPPPLSRLGAATEATIHCWCNV